METTAQPRVQKCCGFWTPKSALNLVHPQVLPMPKNRYTPRYSPYIFSKIWTPQVSWGGGGFICVYATSTLHPRKRSWSWMSLNSGDINFCTQGTSPGRPLVIFTVDIFSQALPGYICWCKKYRAVGGLVAWVLPVVYQMCFVGVYLWFKNNIICWWRRQSLKIFLKTYLSITLAP